MQSLFFLLSIAIGKTLEDLIMILTTPINDWIIWVGAGISSIAPTCLPLGGKLTDFTIRNAFNDSVNTNLKKIWTQAGKILIEDEFKQYFNPIPRLESVLDIINEVEHNASGIEFSFMRGLLSFQKAPFNILHLKLADLMTKGATIITSNFDLCIENAYKYLHGTSDSLTPIETGSITGYRSKNNPKVGKIWHYHGVVNDIKNMGATLSAIKEGLPNSFNDELRLLLNKKKLTFFFGYSFNDAFDINLFFDGIPKETFKYNNAIFYQYHDDPMNISDSDRENQKRITSYLRCFRRARYYYGDTSNFFTLLSEREESFSGEYNWEKKSLENIKFKDKKEVEPFLICQLANFLGINVDKLSSDAFQNARNFEEKYPKNLYLDTMAVSCRGQGNYKLEKKYHLKKQNDENTGDMLGFYYSRGKYKKAQKYAFSPEEIVQIAKESSDELSWKLYTSMSVYCRPLIRKYLLNPLRKKVSVKDKHIIRSYSEMINCLADRPLKEVKNVNQVVTAIRFKFLFSALLTGHPDDHLKEKIFYLYGERSGIEGFISIFRDLGTKELLLAKFHSRNGTMIKAEKYSNLSLELARTVGFRPGIDRAKELNRLIFINRLFI